MINRFLLVLSVLAWLASPARAQPNNAVQQNLTSATCSLTDSTGCVVLTLAGAGGVAVQLQGTFSATVAFEGTVDGATWVALSMTPSNSTTTVTSATGTGVWFAGAGGLQGVRARVSSYSSGTVITNLRSALVSASRGGGGVIAGTDPDVCFYDSTAVSCSDAGITYAKATGILSLTGGLSGASDGNTFSGATGHAANYFTVDGNVWGVRGSASGSFTYLWEAAANSKEVRGSGIVSGWASSTGNSNASTFRGQLDTGLARNAAGVVEVDNGTAGTLRDVLPRLTLDTTAPTSIASTSANSCGTTSPSLGTGAANTRGDFTVGATSGTDCTMTFSVAAAHKWVCAPSNETSAALVRAIPVTTTTTSFQGVFGAGNVIGYLCAPF